MEGTEPEQANAPAESGAPVERVGTPDEVRAALTAHPEAAGRPGPELVVHGVLRRAEVEMGPLVLDAEDGTTWELLLPAGWAFEAELGARVTVAGDPASDVATTAMVGPVLRVRSLRRG